MGYADDTTIYAVISRLVSLPKVMRLLSQNFGSNQPLVFEVEHET